jgi:hypothetical protein
MESTKYTPILTISELDDATYAEARRLFWGYKDKKVITDGLFGDQVWVLTDEYSNLTFDFRISESEFKEYGKILDMSLEEFIKHLQVYVVFRMGELALVSLQQMIAQIKHVLQYPIEDLKNIADTYYIDRIYSISEFFSMLPANGREDAIVTIINELDIADEKLRSTIKSAQRKLATFDSYFKFNDIIESFWVESQDESEKLFYFPLYFWWRISAIIPMRPREIVLTPRNCLSKKDGSWYLTILKNNLKGRDKTVSYKIENDYIKHVYQIPDELADLITWYIKATDDFTENDLKTMFVADTHYVKWGRCKPYSSRFFTYINLSTCLRYFFEQIVVERYGYFLIYERESSNLNSNEINYIYLGDTRHLALINMIAEGATPTVAMMLADHDNPSVSAHYYSNISTLIECKTYRQYSKLLHGKQSYSISKPLNIPNVSEFTIIDKSGRCYSAKVSAGDFSDCSKVAGPSGEIGFCQNCHYYRPEGRLFTDSKDLHTNSIKTECENLGRIVKQVRSMKGNREDIVQALMRLQNAEYSYQQYLFETMKEEN